MYRNHTLWANIRKRVLEKGISRRQVSKETGLHRKTIRKILIHENPPDYSRASTESCCAVKYKKIINGFLKANNQLNPEGQYTTRDIYNYLVSEEDFLGSYSTVYRYVRQLLNKDHNHNDKLIEMVYDFIISSNKNQALALIRNLSSKQSFIFSPISVQQFLSRTSAGNEFLKSLRPKHPKTTSDIEWIRRLINRKINQKDLQDEFITKPAILDATKCLFDNRIKYRNRAIIILSHLHGISIHTISKEINLTRDTVRRIIKSFNEFGEGIFQNNSLDANLNSTNTIQKIRNEKTQLQLEWIANLLMRNFKKEALVQEFNGLLDINIVIKYLIDTRITLRNKATILLCHFHGISIHTISKGVRVSRTTVRSVIKYFNENGLGGLFSHEQRANSKVGDEYICRNIFTLLH